MELEKACKNLIIKDPFYGVFLLNLNKYFTDKCPTACVKPNGINIDLCINKSFWDSLSDEMQLGVLKHELLHIILKHFNFFEVYSNATKRNIAADCEVNSYIPILQNDPYCYPRKWNLENCQGTVYYYNHLPDTEDNNYQTVDDHEEWKDFDKLSDAEKELIGNQVDHIAKQTAEHISKVAGTIPGELKGYIDSLFVQKPAVFNWKKYFRRFLGTALDVDIRKSRKKESLRFPDTSGIKHKRKSSILVGIDMSGSVSNKDICDFFSEINHIYKAGTLVTIVEFDFSIQRIYSYDGKWDKSCSGRGGTNFVPVWDYYQKHKRDYQTLVLFTDGYASTSELGPAPNVVWIITHDGDKNNTYPGKTIFIPNE